MFATYVGPMILLYIQDFQLLIIRGVVFPITVHLSYRHHYLHLDLHVTYRRYIGIGSEHNGRAKAGACGELKWGPQLGHNSS
jgi:hypothetical protein